MNSGTWDRVSGPFPRILSVLLQTAAYRRIAAARSDAASAKKDALARLAAAQAQSRAAAVSPTSNGDSGGFGDTDLDGGGDRHDPSYTVGTGADPGFGNGTADELDQGWSSNAGDGDQVDVSDPNWETSGLA